MLVVDLEEAIRAKLEQRADVLILDLGADDFQDDV
jgi:hypothetical protein